MLEPFYEEHLATIYNGHALKVLKESPDESVQMCMTSPPYWGLRTYKTEPQIWGDNHCEHEWGTEIEGRRKRTENDIVDKDSKEATKSASAFNSTGGNFCLKCHAWRGELGLEPTIELYISHLIQIFDEVKRVLKKTGTCWVNLDDSYAGSGSPGGDFRDGKGGDDYLRPYNRKGLPAKSLCLIPQRFAIAMVEHGWICRNEIPWVKNNPMPESVKDRFTGSWEPVFFFTKNNKPVYWTNSKTFKITGKQAPGTHGVENEDWEWIDHSACQGKGCNNKRCINGKIKSSLWEGHDYWFEQQFEKYTEPMNQWGGDTLKRDTSKTSEYKEIQNIGYSSAFRVGRPMRPNESGRNKRDVWTIPTSPYPEAHFATFPEKLCETPILSGCPAHICKKCGRAREKVYEKGFTDHSGETESDYPEGTTAKRLALLRQAARGKGTEYANDAEFIGYTDCGCNAGFEPGVVLDPFCGSGKALAVAKRLGRRAIGIDLNPDYCKLTVKQLQRISIPMELV